MYTTVRSKLKLCILLNAIFYCELSLAETPNFNVLTKEVDRLQQIQEQQRKVIENKVIAPVQNPTNITVEQVVISSKDESKCFYIDQIDINYTTLLKQREIEQLRENYKESCVHTKNISEIMTELTQLYFEKGYVATRVYLPAQDIKNSKRLVLNVDEGSVSKLTTSQQAKNTISTKTAAPFLVNKALNLRDLEQALDQFNRLQSNNVTMQIQPGDKTGESVIVFDNNPSKRINGYFSFDNKGQDTTGRQQASLGMGIDNVLGLNDLLSISYNRSLPFEIHEKDSEALSAFYVVPFGYHTASLSASNSSYDTTLQTTSEVLHSKGKSESYSMKVDSLIYRDRINQVRTNVGLTTKENKAYLENVLLGVSSRKLTVAELGVSYATQVSNHYINTNLSYQKGLTLFDALHDVESLEKEFPKAQFDKFIYGISYFTPFELAQQKLTFSSDFSGQLSLDPLYGSEQYSIGSLYTVRGFNQKSISGDEGYSLKNDLGLLKTYLLSNGVLTTRYYVGLDYGKVSNKYNSELTGELSSASLGSTLNFHNISLDFILTQPISQPSFLRKKEADFFFSTTFTF